MDRILLYYVSSKILSLVVTTDEINKIKVDYFRDPRSRTFCVVVPVPLYDTQVPLSRPRVSQYLSLFVGLLTAHDTVSHEEDPYRNSSLTGPKVFEVLFT